MAKKKLPEVGPVFDLDNFRAKWVAPTVPDHLAAERAYALLSDTKMPPVISGDTLEDM